MIIREDAIYGRQSVDRKDSISIESQIERRQFPQVHRQGLFRQEYRQAQVPRNDGRYSPGPDQARSGLQAGSYQPFHSGLRNHDGNFSGIQC
jgi:hypothetical protein